MQTRTLAEWGVLAVAFLALIVSYTSSREQQRQTQEALALTKESLAASDRSLIVAGLQVRSAACRSSASHYAAQSWQYGAIPPREFETYGLPPNTEYYEGAPNQVL